ncbi:putative apolipoprotein(a)-like protein 2 isoform X2 [Tubulanus polymorphus]|uniref:putative apolipoprotein(a)-like protein 2 isoform X2 n=1 Tax=Tubulanus polymorphus TaxID=672921 RepID=UPI003DA35259
MPKQRLVKFRGYNDGLMIMDDVLEFFLLILFMIHRGLSAPLECRQTPQGRDYAGYLNVTRSGLACQSWSSQTPHAHSKYTTASEFVDTTVAKASNFCRNPANARADHPWCYTMGNVVTEICTVCRLENAR